VRSVVRDLCSPALLVVLLFLSPLSAVARGETRHVLVLSSAERPVAPQSGFADALVRDLVRGSREPIRFVEVAVQATRAVDDQPGAAVAQRIRTAFGAGRLDLVITIGGPAATLAQQFNHELVPATPTLIAGVDRRFVEHGTFTENETTVATQHDPAMMIDEMLRLLPETRSVMVIIGASPVEQFWLQQMQREFRRFGDRLQFSWTNELSFDEITDRSRTMPPRSAIFFALLSVDGKGEPRVDGDTLQSIHAVANAPLFALYGIGDGIVGGPLLSTAELSHTTAQVALRILAGESPGSIKTPVQRTGRPTYDARELRRWNIDNRRLPSASVVLFREPPFWQRNRGPIAFGVLLGGIPVAAIALVVGVMKQRRTQGRLSVADPVVTPPSKDPTADMAALARTRAELSNLNRHLIREHEREHAVLAKTLREDVGQRMAALTLRLHSLQGPAHAAEVADIRQTLSSLTAEIATASDPVYVWLDLLGLAAAGRRLCEELSAHYDVAIRFQEEDVPRHLPSDIALALFRVLQEATVNAAVHSQAPEIRVSVRGAVTEVRVHVIDRGVGFDVQHVVPGGGVGLVAIRERLKLVNGDGVIFSRPGEGTRVEAWVPLRLHG